MLQKTGFPNFLPPTLFCSTILPLHRYTLHCMYSTLLFITIYPYFSILQCFSSFTRVHTVQYHTNIFLLHYPSLLYLVFTGIMYTVYLYTSSTIHISNFTILHFYTLFSQVNCILYTCTIAVQYILSILQFYTSFSQVYCIPVQ